MNMKILSERGYMKWPSWYVVYEWEDVLSEINSWDIVTYREGIVGKFIRRGIREINSRFQNHNNRYSFNSDESYLSFVMSSASYRDIRTKNVIPIFLDFPIWTVEIIMGATESLPVFFVTCLDIYNEMKRKKVDNVRYIPLSISDKYYSDVPPAKEIDVIQFGRKNKILHDHMLQYCSAHPGIEYVYQTADGTLSYHSTTRGDIGKFDTRDEYMDLIAKARVSLVSSPGIDGGRSDDFGGIDFITPRFYESAAKYCHMLGRYTRNEEVERLELSKVCPCIDSYEEFANYLDGYLSEKSFNWSMQKEFVKKNLTSKRAKYMRDELSNM